MLDPRELDTLLAEMSDDTAPLPGRLRQAILADAAEVASAAGPHRAVPWWRSMGLWGGVLGTPLAALCGVWLGIAQPALVLQAVPGMSLSDSAASEDPLLDDVYGSSWEDWL